MEFSTRSDQIIETFADGSFTLSEVVERYGISEIIRRFGQWVVTKKGIESLVAEYTISITRLKETHWVSHMSEKRWVVINEFEAALVFAKEYYSVESEVIPEIKLLPKNNTLEPSVDYFTAKKLHQSLVAMHRAYNASEKYIPNNIPRPEDAPASFSVKDDFILSPIYSGFSSLFHGFLMCTTTSHLFDQFKVDDLLNLSPNQFRHLLDQILGQVY